MPACQETGPPGNPKYAATTRYNGAPNENIVCMFSPS
jgi:hypothetical protein